MDANCGLSVRIAVDVAYCPTDGGSIGPGFDLVSIGYKFGERPNHIEQRSVAAGPGTVCRSRSSECAKQGSMTRVMPPSALIAHCAPPLRVDGLYLPGLLINIFESSRLI